MCMSYMYMYWFSKYLMYCLSANVFLQIEVLNKHLFLSAKPVIYLVNLSERDYIRKKNKWWDSKYEVWISYTLFCVCVHMDLGWLRLRNGWTRETPMHSSSLSVQLWSWRSAFTWPLSLRTYVHVHVHTRVQIFHSVVIWYAWGWTEEILSRK